MKTSQNILDFIRINGPSTVAEIAAALDRTKADIREQTGHLCSQNRLERLPAGSNDSPGRPAARFACVKTIPDALVKGLLSGFLQYIDKEELEKNQEICVEEMIVEALISNFSPRGSNAASRMNQAIRYLEKIGVQAKWHATHKGPSISIVNEEITAILHRPDLSKKITNGLLLKIKEKAVGASPTA
jgi:predicted ArsR family transcriptional regulator